MEEKRLLSQNGMRNIKNENGSRIDLGNFKSRIPVFRPSRFAPSAEGLRKSRIPIHGRVPIAPLMRGKTSLRLPVSCPPARLQDAENKKLRNVIAVKPCSMRNVIAMKPSSKKQDIFSANEKHPFRVSNNNPSRMKENFLESNRSNHTAKKIFKKKLTPIDEISEDLSSEVSSCAQAENIPSLAVTNPSEERHIQEIGKNDNIQSQNVSVLQVESVFHREEVKMWQTNYIINKQCDNAAQTQCLLHDKLRQLVELRKRQVSEVEKLCMEHFQEIENICKEYLK